MHLYNYRAKRRLDYGDDNDADDFVAPKQKLIVKLPITTRKKQTTKQEKKPPPKKQEPKQKTVATRKSTRKTGSGVNNKEQETVDGNAKSNEDAQADYKEQCLRAFAADTNIDYTDLLEQTKDMTEDEIMEMLGIKKKPNQERDANDNVDETELLNETDGSDLLKMMSKPVKKTQRAKAKQEESKGAKKNVADGEKTKTKARLSLSGSKKRKVTDGKQDSDTSNSDVSTETRNKNAEKKRQTLVRNKKKELFMKNYKRTQQLQRQAARNIRKKNIERKKAENAKKINDVKKCSVNLGAKASNKSPIKVIQSVENMNENVNENENLNENESGNVTDDKSSGGVYFSDSDEFRAMVQRSREMEANAPEPANVQNLIATQNYAQRSEAVNLMETLQPTEEERALILDVMYSNNPPEKDQPEPIDYTTTATVDGAQQIEYLPADDEEEEGEEGEEENASEGNINEYYEGQELDSENTEKYDLSAEITEVTNTNNNNEDDAGENTESVQVVSDATVDLVPTFQIVSMAQIEDENMEVDVEAVENESTR